jgi:peptidoglycan/LPS O-acetylase OafA/YrhL
MGALRFFLAFGVLYSHVDQQLLNLNLKVDWRLVFGVNGGYCVLFFYVVSGFLISYALETKYNGTGLGRYQFYKSRFLRIFPLWWAVLAFTLLVTTGDLRAWIAQRSVLEMLSVTFLFGSDWMLSFAQYPAANWPQFPYGTGIAWTLGVELTFYAIAPFLLRSSRLSITVFLLSGLLRVVLYTVELQNPHDWVFFFFPGTLMFFMAGHLSRLFYKRFPFNPRLVLVLLPLAATCMLQITDDMPLDNIYFYVALPCLALSLPCLFERTKDNHVMNLLGDLTYPLYLVHSLCIAAIFTKWSGIGTWGGKFISIAQQSPDRYNQALVIIALISAYAICVAIITRFLVELPLVIVARTTIAWFESKVAPKPPAPRFLATEP